MAFIRGSDADIVIGEPMPVMAGAGGGDVLMPPGPAQAVARVARDKAIKVRSAVMENSW
jgi:poly(3-hydroxybutyrate) depolymerase